MDKKEIKLGQRIKQIRETRELTTKELANLSGTAESIISRVERGEATLSINKLYSIADALKVNPAEMFFSDEDFWFDKGEINCNNFIKKETDDYFWELLLSKKAIESNPIFYPYKVSYKDNRFPSFHKHPGWELIFLLKGKLCIHLKDQYLNREEKVLLENRSSSFVLIHGLIPHSYIKMGKETESLNIISDVRISRDNEDYIDLFP